MSTDTVPDDDAPYTTVRDKEAKNAAAERFQMYRLGWKTGARRGPKSPGPTTREDLVEAYTRGHSHGRDAHAQAMTAEAGRLGYVPSILREEG